MFCRGQRQSQNMGSKQEVKNFTQVYVDNLVERITERFDDSDHPIFSAMKFADPAAWSVSLKRAFEHKEKYASLAFRARDPEVLNEEEKAFVSSFLHVNSSLFLFLNNLLLHVWYMVHLQTFLYFQHIT